MRYLGLPNPQAGGLSHVGYPLLLIQHMQLTTLSEAFSLHSRTHHVLMIRDPSNLHIDVELLMGAH
jgi:hypothetical protein